MKLKDILNEVEVLDVLGEVNYDEDIDAINYHSGNVFENNLFVAISGYITDGHKYIKSARENGAKYAVVEYFIDEDIPQIKVKNTRIALADMATNFYENPSKELSIVGVTATNGKTTTAFMIDEIYKKAGYKTGIIGSVVASYDNVKIPAILTTPDSLELQMYFRDMVNKGIDKVTMEVSSSAQELYRVKNIEYDIVTFNNFSREHIDQHGSFENYYKVKSKLIKEASEDSVAILNMDFEKIAKLKDETKAQVITYSLENNDYDFSISNLDLSTGKGNYKFNVNRDIEVKGRTIEKGSFDINLAVAGYSSVMNSVVAIIVALVDGIDREIIIEAMKEFSGVERRFEMIYDEDFKIIDDHYANSRNIEVTLSTLSKMQYSNFRMVYAIRGNRGVNLNRESAEMTAQWLKKLKPKTFYATLSKDTVTSKDEVSDEELKVFCEVMSENNIDVKIFDTLEESVVELLKTVESDDAVLFAGCQGMDKGAKFASDYLVENDLAKDKDKLVERIDNRVC
ncbi:UDP-N-acetylmuramoylalanyl-D-glutamate--2,6-diaminopimelate ligase [Anaerosphaera aminiphila DSM 21120]|uniref:UDP-N-acetylmuramoylalanyl-D-glutamate--2,6-diaminopimelate ligase n=1 Tax=Anaerosphaera aminiphila DSM 21120 TaxID=1120995 RepID=A0A1M5UUU3_9FIRM|nr:Mur ligase family protein [Anaerosphaera aminiphila]SHH66787.1 UDP-N-acetylmuramoylalanyl-D-glutamate--2,6-diaminopimelate ligase [Anaerosphaera aminiphila DSM 21120]